MAGDEQLNQITQQLALITQSLAEEKARREAAEARLATLETTPTPLPAPTPAQTTPAPPITATTAILPTPKVATPTPFSGNRGVEAEVYASQVGLYVRINRAMFPDDESKVLFALSYLTGKAALWAQPMIDRCLNPTATTTPVTWMEFSESFRAIYFDTHRQDRAEAALRKLKQTKSVADYVMQFNQHATATGWEVPTLISQFRQGLKAEIRVAMVRDRFTELSAITTLATAIDNELHGDRFGIDSPPVASTSRDTAPAHDPDAMDCSAARFDLSKAEVSKRMKSGDCFKCGVHGHIARHCPGKKGKGKTGGNEKVAEVEVKDQAKEMAKSAADESKNGAARD